MKISMKREHAEFLKRQFMGMELGHDIMLGLCSRKALAHEALSGQTEQQNAAAFHDSYGSRSIRRSNSSKSNSVP